MTRTARRRWTREIRSEVDGIALGATGPVLLHGYDPPAGGMWIDSTIPGKLAAFDRNDGDRLWVSPCEVGYGRGFGAGFGREGEVIVLGPSSSGYRIVRMAADTGELMAAAEIEPFDQAIVDSDVCICVSAHHVTAFDSQMLIESWRYEREGERYHLVGREGSRVFIVYTLQATGKQGVLCLDPETGDLVRKTMKPTQSVIHDLSVDSRGLVVLTEDLPSALPPELVSEYLSQLAAEGEGADGLALLAMDPVAEEGDSPLWFEMLSRGGVEDLPDVSITADSGKLYVLRGAHIEVRDALTGRTLGDWTVPGLDERVAWNVCQGAGLLAEETRVSVFELLA